MKGKKLLYTVSILILAILAIVVSEKLNKKAPTETSLKFFPTCTEKNISEITIKDSKDSVKVRRKGDVWVVSRFATGSVAQSPLNTGSEQTTDANLVEFPADSASVATVLEKIVNMKKGELISENPAKQSIFEVDSSKGILVDVLDESGKSKGSFRIGKNGADWSSSYVRMVGSNAVYMVGGRVRYSFFTDLKRWRDKSIIKFDRSAAKRITLIKKGGSSLTVAKADTGSD